MEKETGEIQNGDLFLEDGHVSMSGSRLQKLGGQSYHVDDGFFTTCLCETGAPSWKFYAEQMNLDLQGVGHGQERLVLRLRCAGVVRTVRYFSY
jgi:lipopolysaccharide assembly outer membrane protein LptD (OstA)